MKSTVWINGEQIGYRPNGYLSLFYELTPHLKKGKNILTVKVDNSLQPSARWYTGSGIYRHVNLGRHGQNPSRKRRDLRYDARSEQRTRTSEFRSGDRQPPAGDLCTHHIRHPGRRRPRSSRISERARLVNGKNIVSGQLEVASPRLWSPETPELYTLKTIIESEGRKYDEYPTRFGIRKLEYDPSFGSASTA